MWSVPRIFDDRLLFWERHGMVFHRLWPSITWEILDFCWKVCIFLWSGDKANAKQVPVRDVVSWILVSPGEFSCPKELLANRPKKLLHWKGHGVRPAGPEGKLLRFRWVLEHGRGQKVAPKQNRSETAQPSLLAQPFWYDTVHYWIVIYIYYIHIYIDINIEHWNILSSYIYCDLNS